MLTNVVKIIDLVGKRGVKIAKNATGGRVNKKRSDSYEPDRL